MKLLLDENISWRLIKKLSLNFADIIHVNSLNIDQPASDIFIWNYAKTNGYTIVTKDDDFEKIVLLKKSSPKLIYLKTFNLNTNEIADLIIQNKDNIVTFIKSVDNDIFEIYSN